MVLDFGGPQPLAGVEAAAQADAGRRTARHRGGRERRRPDLPRLGPRCPRRRRHSTRRAGRRRTLRTSPEEQKPDLYAAGRLASTAISSMIADPAVQGTSVAALNAAAAAIVVWASDRGQTAPDVHRVLIDTARPLDPGDARSARVLDVDAALAATRRQLLLDTLQNEPLELSQVLAETGLRPEVAVPLVDELVESGRLSPQHRRRRRGAGGPREPDPAVRPPAHTAVGMGPHPRARRPRGARGRACPPRPLHGGEGAEPVGQRPRRPADRGAGRHRGPARARQSRHRAVGRGRPALGVRAVPRTAGRSLAGAAPRRRRPRASWSPRARPR